jgi:hypothetical protein
VVGGRTVAWSVHELRVCRILDLFWNDESGKLR